MVLVVATLKAKRVVATEGMSRPKPVRVKLVGLQVAVAGAVGASVALATWQRCLRPVATPPHTAAQALRAAVPPAKEAPSQALAGALNPKTALALPSRSLSTEWGVPHAGLVPTGPARRASARHPTAGRQTQAMLVATAMTLLRAQLGTAATRQMRRRGGRRATRECQTSAHQQRPRMAVRRGLLSPARALARPTLDRPATPLATTSPLLVLRRSIGLALQEPPVRPSRSRVVLHRRPPRRQLAIAPPGRRGRLQLRQCPLRRCPLQRCPLRRCLLRRCLLQRCLLRRCLLQRCLLRRCPLRRCPLRRCPLQ